jgi:hypothetical protein
MVLNGRWSPPSLWSGICIPARGTNAMAESGHNDQPSSGSIVSRTERMLDQSQSIRLEAGNGDHTVLRTTEKWSAPRHL